MSNEPLSTIPDQLERQFEQLGQDLGMMMLKQFKTLLQSERQNIEKTLEIMVNNQRGRILKQVQIELEKEIFQQFNGDGALFTLVAGDLLPNIIGKLSGNSVSGTPVVPSFKRNGSQQLSFLGKLIQRNLGRN